MVAWLVSCCYCCHLDLDFNFLPINKFNGLRLVIHERRMHLNLLWHFLLFLQKGVKWRWSSYFFWRNTGVAFWFIFLLLLRCWSSAAKRRSELFPIRGGLVVCFHVSIQFAIARSSTYYDIAKQTADYCLHSKTFDSILVVSGIHICVGIWVVTFWNSNWEIPWLNNNGDGAKRWLLYFYNFPISTFIRFIMFKSIY